MATNTAHDLEMIEIFGEDTWDYPVNRYVDPNVAPGPGNSLAERLYNDIDFATHVARMGDALLAYDGETSSYLEQPYVVVVEPRRRTLYLHPGDTEADFEVSPYEQPSAASYAWYVDGEPQDSTDASLTHTFTY